MSSQEAYLRRMVRHGKLKDEDWIAMIKNRVELIIPHLKSFSLSELRYCECLDQYADQDVTLARYRNKFEKQDVELSTRGIFNRIWKHPEKIERSDPKKPRLYTRHVWGLTRHGEWLLATIIFFRPNRNQWYDEPVRLHLKKSSFEEITKLVTEADNLSSMWYTLGRQIKIWEENRRSLHSEARRLASIVEIEESVLDEMRGSKEDEPPKQE